MLDELEIETRKLYILMVAVCCVVALTFLYALLIDFGVAHPLACQPPTAPDQSALAPEWRRG